MKQTFSFLLTSLLMLVVLSSEINAQWAYLDVAPGYETLNNAILNDNAAPDNRVYRLKRGDVYLLNGTIKGTAGKPLRIWAEEGTGRIPLILTTATESGVAYRAFEVSSDIHLKNVYLSGRNNLGIYTDDGKDMIRLAQAGIKAVVEGCFLEHEWKDFFRMNAKNQKVFVKNSILRNGGDITDASDNQFIDTRGQDQDTIFIQNSTLYTATGRAFRSGTAYFRTFIVDHCTFYQLGNGDGARGLTDTSATPIFDVRLAQNVSVTNNLFIDMAFAGDEKNSYTGPTDTLDYPLFGFTSIIPLSKQDATRNIVIKNNVVGASELFDLYYKQKDTIKAVVLLNKYSINKYFNRYPNTWKHGNNLVENVKFLDAPSEIPAINYVAYRRANNFTEEGCPEYWADRNGIGADPTTWGPASNEFKFSYASTYKAYNAAERGFPVGDLNWFPTLKALWEAGGTVGVEKTDGVIPTEYSLEQNFPNPFNPVTIISYSIPQSSNVTLTIYNTLGQKIETLVNNLQEAGSYKVQWDANKYSSGMYVYQLHSNNTLITKKMILIK